MPLSRTLDIPLVAAKRQARPSLPAAFFAIAYGAMLALLPIEGFKDRDNYLSYAEGSLSIVHGLLDLGLLAALVNEPVWLLLNHGLSLLMEPEPLLRMLVGVPAALVAWLTLTRAQTRGSVLWLVLALFLPQVIKNHIVHVRQGVAIAVFLVGWFAVAQPRRILCFALAPFIHASFFFVLAVLAMVHVLDRMKASASSRSMFGLAACFVIGGATQLIATAVGARQAEEYEFFAKEVSGLGFLLWSGALLATLAEGRRFIVAHSFELFSIALYLSMYFVVEVSARIFESAMLVVLIAALSTTDWRRQVLQASIAFQFVYQYVAQMDQPRLGFGA